MKIRLLHLLLLAFMQPACAQNFQYKAKISPPSADGYYRIALHPDLVAHAAPLMRDVRLFDNTGKEIPYLYKKEEEGNTDIDFVSYPVLQDKQEGKWQEILVENVNAAEVDHFIFEMKNAETGREVRISGSNDRNIWYVVRERFYLGLSGDPSAAQQQTGISFPRSDYHYFKIEIRNPNAKPLNIVRVGYNSSQSKQAVYQRVGLLQMQRSDTNKETRIHLSLPRANRIDKLLLYIREPLQYHRNAYIIIPPPEHGMQPYGSSKHRDYESMPMSTYELSSELPAVLSVYDLFRSGKTSGFNLVIRNYDDAPLQIDSIAAWQLSESILAKLRSDRSYVLYFGDSLLQAPNYDLKYFENKIPSSPAFLQAGDVQLMDTPLAGEYDRKRDRLIVWIGIAVVALILLVLTLSMAKKLGREEAN